MKIDSISLTHTKNVKKPTFYKTKGFQGYLSATAAVDSTAPLLAEQEFLEFFQLPDLTSTNANTAYTKGETLLMLLTALRIDLLNGNIPYSRIQALQHFLRLLPQNADPTLQGILDDITLRVQIELAKIDQMPE